MIDLRKLLYKMRATLMEWAVGLLYTINSEKGENKY
jgi:hypothetical protein